MNTDTVRMILERDKRRVGTTVDNASLASGLSAVVKQYFAAVGEADCSLITNRDGSVSINFSVTAEGIRTK